MTNSNNKRTGIRSDSPTFGLKPTPGTLSLRSMDAIIASTSSKNPLLNVAAAAAAAAAYDFSSTFVKRETPHSIAAASHLGSATSD